MKINYLCILLMLLSSFIATAQEEKPELTLSLNYHALNNRLPYLVITTKYKSEKAFETVKGVKVKLYLGEESEAGMIGEIVTNDKGLGKLVLPPTAKAGWDSTTRHNFIAVSSETSRLAETRSEAEIARARITMDTTLDEEGKRALAVKVEEFDGTAWNPAADVELKIGVERLGGWLPISSEESYTTDSTGMVTAAFERDRLPSPAKSGNLILAAKVEDHESYGNLLLEKTVPWGVYRKAESNFGERSLWATRDKTPLWLLAMAYAIILGVWLVIVYLFFILAKVIRAGKKDNSPAAYPDLISREEFQKV